MYLIEIQYSSVDCFYNKNPLLWLSDQRAALISLLPSSHLPFSLSAAGEEARQQLRRCLRSRGAERLRLGHADEEAAAGKRRLPVWPLLQSLPEGQLPAQAQIRTHRYALWFNTGSDKKGMRWLSEHRSEFLTLSKQIKLDESAASPKASSGFQHRDLVISVLNLKKQTWCDPTESLNCTGISCFIKNLLAALWAWTVTKNTNGDHLKHVIIFYPQKPFVFVLFSSFWIFQSLDHLTKPFLSDLNYGKMQMNTV